METGLYSAVESVFDLGLGSRFVFSKTETLLKRVKLVAGYSWLHSQTVKLAGYAQSATMCYVVIASRRKVRYICLALVNDVINK